MQFVSETERNILKLETNNKEMMNGIMCVNTGNEYYDEICNKDLHKIVKQLCKEMEFKLNRHGKNDMNIRENVTCIYPLQWTGGKNHEICDFIFNYPRVQEIYFTHNNDTLKSEHDLEGFKGYAKHHQCKFGDINLLGIREDQMQFIRTNISKVLEIFPNLKKVVICDGGSHKTLKEFQIVYSVRTGMHEMVSK
jgi:hypothetical protein